MSRPSLAPRHLSPSMRELAGQAFSRAAGSRLVEGNSVRLLRDARENYPAWLEAIGAARRYVHFENYIIQDDRVGRQFAEALMAKARAGVAVRVAYDWLGCFWKASRDLWHGLRASGAEVRCFNSPRFDSPLGWISRDHRKSLTVDGEVAFVSGLCLSADWLGDPKKGLEPWRDTGAEIRGPAVADIEEAFARIWDIMGEPLPPEEVARREGIEPAGSTALRVVADEPSTGGLFRLDQLVAALATERLWLSDAYFAGTTSYVQALCSAARDGIDVRLLVPNSTDIPLLKPLSRSGYRPLLEAGVRIFEWNGTMLHAKSAVADRRWARIGSTNLNLASWLGNCELDVVVEDPAFAAQMEAAYLEDLENATEVVLGPDHRPHAPGAKRRPGKVFTRGRGSGGRAAAGAVRLGSAVGAAFTNRRTLEPVEGKIIAAAAAGLLALGALCAWYPRLLTYPLVAILCWVALALFVRSWRLIRTGQAARASDHAEPMRRDDERRPQEAASKPSAAPDRPSSNHPS